MKSLVFLALVFSLLPCFSKGRENARTCRIIFLDRPRNAPESVELFDGISSRKVPLSDMNFSDVITLPSGDLKLGLTQHPVSNTGEIPAGAPTVKIPAKTTDFFLILVSDPENEILPIRMLPVDASDEHPKPGQTLWINLSKHNIKGNLGNGSITIAPEERVIGDAPLPASGYFRAEFQYQPKCEGEFLPVMKKSWWFDAKSKSLGFIIDSGGRLPRIFTFRDHRTPAAGEGD